MNTKWVWGIGVILVGVIGLFLFFCSASVNERYSPMINIAIDLSSSAELNKLLSAKILNSEQTIPSADVKYLVCRLQNKGNSGAWGVLGVHVPGLELVKIHVPFLEPNQSNPVLFIVYLGNAISDNDAKNYRTEWIQLSAK